MCEKIVKIIFDYTIHGKLADENFARQIIDIIVTEKELGAYVRESKVKTCKRIGGSGYNMRNGELEISLYDDFRPYRSIFPIVNKILLCNINVALSILHELDHTALAKEMARDEGSFDSIVGHLICNIKNPRLVELTDEEMNALTEDEQKQLVSECLSSSAKLAGKILFYYAFHDMSPVERRANINSHLTLSQMLAILYDTSISDKDLDKVRELKLKEFIGQCRWAYFISDGITNAPTYDYIRGIQLEEELSAIDIYSKNALEAYQNAKDKYTLQQRILHGLPLTSEELSLINKKSNPFGAYKKRIR